MKTLEVTSPAYDQLYCRALFEKFRWNEHASRALLQTEESYFSHELPDGKGMEFNAFQESPLCQSLYAARQALRKQELQPIRLRIPFLVEWSPEIDSGTISDEFLGDGDCPIEKTLSEAFSRAGEHRIRQENGCLRILNGDLQCLFSAPSRTDHSKTENRRQ